MTREKTPENLLEVENLRVHYRSEAGIVRAVDDVSFTIRPNEALVVLGESGCGKSSLAKSLLRIMPRNLETCSGRIILGGRDVINLSEDNFRREVRWSRISLVMQTAMNALNPVVKVGRQVTEPLEIHSGWSRQKAAEKATEVFRKVGIPPDFLERYPFELSGGMRQRAILAMALVTEPDIVILDEPTSALDVLTQANIMNVLKEIKKNETRTGFMLITHDISTSSEIADRVALMYAGQIVELSTADNFFRNPAHPYSKALLSSVPRLRQSRRPEPIPGQPPNLIKTPSGCRFAERCPSRFEACIKCPELFHISPTQAARCWLHAR